MQFHDRLCRCLLVLLAVLMALCSALVTVAAQEPVKLRVGLRGDPEHWHKLLPGFQASHPGIVVDTVEQVDWNMDKVIMAEVAGQPYDVVYAVIEQAWALVDEGMLVPLNSFMARDDDPALEEFVEDVHPSLMEIWQSQGQQYYLPFEWNNMLMYYNTARYDEFGIPYPDRNWTWDDFVKNAKRLTVRDSEGTITLHGYGGFWWNPFGIAPWIFSSGGRILNDAWTESTMNDPKVIEAIDFLQDLFLEDEVLALDSPAPESGDLAMWGAGRWPIQWYRQNEFDDYDIQLWPQEREQMTVLGGGGHAISASSQNRDAAWAFIKWINSKEVVDYWTRIGDSNPSRRSVAMSDAVLGMPPPSGILYYEALDGIRSVPAPPQYPEIARIFDQQLAAVWSGEVSPKAAVEEMHRLINLALQETP